MNPTHDPVIHSLTCRPDYLVPLLSLARLNAVNEFAIFVGVEGCLDL